MGFGLSSIAKLAGPIGSMLGAFGAYKGAGTEVRGAQSAEAGLVGEQRLGREKAQELYGSYLPAGEYGAEATQRLRDILIGGDRSKFIESPGYQFRLEEGIGAIEKAGAARGMRRGSRTLKSISDYAQRSASDEFSNYLNQLSGFAAQAGQTGLAGAGGIMSQYGDVSPLNIAQARIGTSEVKSARTGALWGGLGQGIQGIGQGQQFDKLYKKPPGGVA